MKANDWNKKKEKEPVFEITAMNEPRDSWFPFVNTYHKLVLTSQALNIYEIYHYANKSYRIHD